MPTDEIIDNEIVVEDAVDKTTYHFVNTQKHVNVLSKITYKKEDKFIVFPFYIDRETNSAKNKYRTLESLTFEGFKGRIPSGFLTKAIRGYGATRNLKPLMRFVEENFTVTNFHLSKKQQTGVMGNALCLNYKEFEDVRKGLCSIIRSSNEQNKNFLDNYFARYFPSKFQVGKARYQGGIISRIVTQYSNIETNLSSDDKDALFEFFGKLSLSRKNVFEKQELVKTREIIEKKFIEDILREFERYLKRKTITEQKWHDFFKENLWIFSQLFSYPAVIFKDKAYVGGKTITDQQGKIVDFLCANKLTMNTAIIEIKKHNSKMFGKKPYRGSDVLQLIKN